MTVLLSEPGEIAPQATARDSFAFMETLTIADDDITSELASRVDYNPPRFLQRTHVRAGLVS